MCKGLGGSQTAGLNALTTEGYVQAKGRLQCWNSKSWRPEGLVEAAARDLEGFRGFKRLKAGKRQAKGRLQCWNSKSWRPEGLVEAAARDLEGFRGFMRLKAGKRQAWTP